MLLQPKNEEYDKATSKIQDKIKLLKRTLTLDGKNVKKDDRTTSHQIELLNVEYEKLAQLRLEQCHSLKTQWDVYRNEQRLFRKKDIEARQVEFDKELSVLDRKRRMKWKNNSSLEELSNDEIRHQLRDKLVNYVKQDTDRQSAITMSKDEQPALNMATDEQTSVTMETDAHSIITLPTDILEYFWLLDIEIPIMKSELLNTISILDVSSQLKQ